MRTLAVLLAATLLSGCSSTVMMEPGIYVSPYLALYQLRGNTKMQSEGTIPSEIVNNPRLCYNLFHPVDYEKCVAESVTRCSPTTRSPSWRWPPATTASRSRRETRADASQHWRCPSS